MKTRNLLYPDRALRRTCIVRILDEFEDSNLLGTDKLFAQNLHEVSISRERNFLAAELNNLVEQLRRYLPDAAEQEGLPRSPIFAHKGNRTGEPLEVQD